MRSNHFLVFLAICSLLTACQSEVIDNSMIVNVDNVSFEEDVLPILLMTCGGGNCHVEESTNGVNVSNFQQLMTSVGTQYNSGIVIAGNGAGSPLVEKLRPNPSVGERMPLDAPTLTNAQIETIETWIDEGAEDN